MKISVITLAIGLLFSLHSIAQEPLPVTINPINETFQVDTLANDAEELEIDIAQDQPVTKLCIKTSGIQLRLNIQPIHFQIKNDTVIISLFNSGDSPFVMPIKGQILSKFGPRHRRMHTGTDIRAEFGRYRSLRLLMVV